MSTNLADRVEGLTKALERIRDYHIPDQPTHFGGDEVEWVTRQFDFLRSIAHAALVDGGKNG